MTDFLNILGALLSIGFGAFGFLAPRFTAGVLDLQTTATNMGLSEMRASVGCLFVGLGLGALFLSTPTAYAMVGFAWGGAAVGRLVSCLAENRDNRKAWFYFAVEAVVSIALLAINL